jgi:hypothetical protein
VSFHSVSDWQTWQLASSPYEFLSFCGGDENMEQWVYLKTQNGAVEMQQNAYWYMHLNMFPLQNDSALWLQRGMGANGVNSEDGIAMEFGYNALWTNINGLDFAVLQGVGRIALTLGPAIPFPSNIEIQTADDTYVLDCNRRTIHAYDSIPRDTVFNRRWDARYSWGEYWYQIGYDSVIDINAPGVYRYVLELVSGSANYNVFTITQDSLKVSVTSQIQETIDASSIYLFAGNTLTEPGYYYDTLQTAYGCDSIVQLLLRVADNSLCSISQSETLICSGDEIELVCNSEFTPTEGYQWSIGDVSNQIIVEPADGTAYFCALHNEFYDCTASITMEVDLSDSDFDGVCDVKDICADSPEIGQPCDDGDPCSLLDTVQPDCSCVGISDPNAAFTLTPSAEKVCGSDSAYFSISGPASAVVNYTLNDEPFSLILDLAGEASIHIALPIVLTDVEPVAAVVKLLSFELVEGTTCDNNLSITDSLLYYNGFRPYFSFKSTDIYDCEEYYPNPYLNYVVESPIGSTVYLSTNFNVSGYVDNYVNGFTGNQVAFTSDESTYPSSYITIWDLDFLPQNSDFIASIDSIDYGGCVAEMNGIADTTRIPSARLTAYPYNYQNPVDGLYRVCNNYYSYDEPIPLLSYWIWPTAYRPEEWSYDYDYLLDFDFEFEINGTLVHFNNFQSNSSYYGTHDA